MDILTYALANGLSEKIIQTVASGVTEATVTDNIINFTFADGSTAEMVFEKPKNGLNGVSVTDLYINYKNNHLMVVFSDGHVQDAGEVPPLQSGMSAYEIAVKYGYDGSEEEWLDYIKGDDGEKGDSITARVDKITQDERELGSRITLTSSNPLAEPIPPIDLYNGVSPTVSTEPLSDGSGNIVTFTYADPYSNDDGGRHESIYVYHGQKGEKGDDGKTFNLLGQVNSETDLPDTGNENDAFFVGNSEETKVVYIQDSLTESWKNVGPIQGVAGKDGKDAVPPTVELLNYDDGQGSTGTKIVVTNYVDGVPQPNPTQRIVLNGRDGIDGVDGYNPQCTLTSNAENPNKFDLDVTYKDSTSGEIKHLTYQLTKGIDGTSAYITVTQTANGYIFNVRDANNPTGTDYEITNGLDGVSSNITCTRNQNDDGYDIVITSGNYPEGHTITVYDGNTVTITPEPITEQQSGSAGLVTRTGYRYDIVDENGLRSTSIWNGVDCTITETEMFDVNDVTKSLGYELVISDANGLHQPIYIKHGESVVLTETRNETDTGYIIDITDINGTRSIELKDGEKGDQGYSPTITTEKLDDGYSVTITDINGSQTIKLKNGKNGSGGVIMSYIVGDEPFTETWLSDESDGEPIVPEEGFIYQIKTSVSEYDEKMFSWDGYQYNPIVEQSGIKLGVDGLGNVGYFNNNTFNPFISNQQNFLPSGIKSNEGTYKLNDEEISYEVFATSFHKLRDDWKAFDGEQDSAQGTTQVSDQYLQISLDKAFIPQKIAIQVGYAFSSEIYEAPTVRVTASNDDFESSTQIQSKSGCSIGDRFVEDLNIDTAYKAYRISISGASNGVGITEFQLFRYNETGVFTGATENTDGTIGYVPRPSAGQEELFLKGDGNWSELPEFKGVGRGFKAYLDEQYIGRGDHNSHPVSFSFKNDKADTYYKLKFRSQCELSSYTSFITALTFNSATNAVFVNDSIVIENGTGYFIVKSIDDGDVTVNATIIEDSSQLQMKRFYVSVDINEFGSTGVVPRGWVFDSDYGSKFLGNDGKWHGLDKVVSPFSYTEAAYDEKGSGNLDAMTEGLNSVSITIPNEATDLVYFRYHTENTSNIVSFSATNADYDTSTIADYGVQDNLHNDYEIILTPTAEEDIEITMSVYSGHTSNTQSYKYGKYTADYYTDGYVVAPKVKPDELEYFGSDGKWHIVDTTTVLTEAKEYTDDKFAEATEHTDTEFITATEHTDELYDNAISHSDENLEAAKDFSRKYWTGKGYNTNAMITPDFRNVLQEEVTLVADTDTTYEATEECVVFFSMVVDDVSYIAVNGVHLTTYDTYYYLNAYDTFTINAAEGSYIVYGVRNNNASGKIYQNTIVALTDDEGNVELPINDNNPVHVIGIHGHFTDQYNTDSFMAIPFTSNDGTHYANITNGNFSFGNAEVSLTYWYMTDYTATVTGKHTKEVIIHPSEITNESPLENYPYKYTLEFEQSRDTSFVEVIILKGAYINQMMAQTTDGYVNILFASMPGDDLTVEVNVFDNAATKVYNQYSTNEQVVGQQIDGKLIYRQTFNNLDIQLSQNGSYYAQTPIYALIENVDNLINATAYSLNGSDARFVMPVTISIDSEGNWSIKGVDVQKPITALTIEYTKL